LKLLLNIVEIIFTLHKVVRQQFIGEVAKFIIVQCRVSLGWWWLFKCARTVETDGFITQDSGDRRIHHSGQWRQTGSSLRTVETDGFITQDSGDSRIHHSGQWRQTGPSLRTVETDGFTRARFTATVSGGCKEFGLVPRGCSVWE